MTKASIDWILLPPFPVSTLVALCLLQDEHVKRLSSTQWSRGAFNKVQYLSSLHDYVDLIVVACSFSHSAKNKPSLDFDNCTFAGPSNVFYIHIRFSFFSFSSRNAQITMTVKQGHRMWPTLHRLRPSASPVKRQVCKEEEEAIKVDVHEGYGRVKLLWILTISDECNLKVLVEFRNILGLTCVCRNICATPVVTCVVVYETNWNVFLAFSRAPSTTSHLQCTI